MENENKSEGIKKPLNLFFCFEEKPSYFDELKQIIESKKSILIIKGEFNKTTIVNEVSYYLGIEDEEREEINEKETQNIIIFYNSLNQSKEILFSFLDIFKENITNDDHPFFIFLPYEKEINANFNKKQLMIDINNYENKESIIDIGKLDSRNISFETKETILNRIEKIYNYFNENDEENIEINDKTDYDITKTVNILTIGKRGSGKSSLINRILGEKKAYAKLDAKTLKTKEYYHNCYPIKFIDSAGFEIGTLNQIDYVTEFLKTNNLNIENIKKKIHFIFYLIKKNDKIEDIEIEVIRKLYSFNIEVFFIITFMEQGTENIFKNQFKSTLKKNKFSKEDINKIINNTFFIDLVNTKYIKTLSNILSSLYKKIEKYEESNNIIKESIIKYNNSENDNENKIEGQILKEEKEEENDLKNKKEISKGLLIENKPKNPNDLLKIIEDLGKGNIFFINFETDRENKKKMSQDLVNKFLKPGFWWSTITIPFLNEYLSKKSKEKMINKLAKIYGLEIKEEELSQKKITEPKKKDKLWVKFIFKIGGVVAGFWNEERVEKLGATIIEELDYNYSKLNIIDVYYDNAIKLSTNFNKLKDFPNLFKGEYWYDIDIEQDN